MEYKYKPKNKEELIEAIKKEIYEVQGTKNKPNWKADLNCIDTSEITDMSGLFSDKYELDKFNGDISEWDVSNVRNMEYMFAKSKFNQDISNWDVYNVESMEGMFRDSEFNGDIYDWEIDNVENINYMFANSKFNQDISDWDVSGVKHSYATFKDSAFNGDIGDWPEEIKKETGLKNISVSEEYEKIPDIIVSEATKIGCLNLLSKRQNEKQQKKQNRKNKINDILNTIFKRNKKTEKKKKKDFYEPDI